MVIRVAPVLAGDASEPALAPSAAPVVLSLDELERIALESNPTLIQAAMAVRAAEGNYLQAGLRPNPSLGYIADEVGNDGGRGLQGAFVSQEIVTAGKLRLGRAVAGWEIQQARHVWESQRRRVLSDVRAGYYELLVATRTVEVNKQLVRIGDEGVKTAEKLRAAAEVSRGDVLQAQIEAETAKLNLMEAEHAQRAAWQRLAAAIGRPEMEMPALTGQPDQQLPALDWEQTLRQLYAQSPELALARASVQRARCELARQYAMRVPNLQLASAIKYDTVSGYTVADVEVGLPLPLFDRNQGRIAREQANLVAAQNEVRRIELCLYSRLASAFEKYATARRRVEAYSSTIMPHAKASLDLITAGYRAGEFGYVSLLTAQRTFFEVSLNYLRNLREFWIAYTELENLLLRGGLEAVERPEPSVD